MGERGEDSVVFELRQSAGWRELHARSADAHGAPHSLGGLVLDAGRAGDGYAEAPNLSGGGPLLCATFDSCEWDTLSLAGWHRTDSFAKRRHRSIDVDRLLFGHFLPHLFQRGLPLG